jgi:hypothetical protein
MIDDDAYYADVIVTRKPPPEPLASFVCAICEQVIQPQPFFWDREFRTGPICLACCRRWGGSTWTRTIARKHSDPIMRLAAIVHAFDWKVKNVRYRY